MGKEADTERKCVKIANDHGYLLSKWASPGQRGVPDRILIRPGGRVDFIEFKALGKKPTKLQQFVLNGLREFGCRAHVIDSVEKFKELIDEQA